MSFITMYRSFMRLLPAGFRARFGEDMVNMIRVRRDEWSGRAPWFWASEYFDLGVTVCREWQTHARQRTSAGVKTPLRRRVLHQPFGSGIGGDIRLAIRNVWTHRGFSAVVILTLALGIGVNAAIFSIVDTVVLRPLPYEDPHAIVGLVSANTQSGSESNSISYADFLVFRNQATAFEAVAGYDTGVWPLSGEGRVPRRVDAAAVTSGFFSALGVQPILGRTFLEEEHLPDRHGALIVSYSFWQAELGGRSDVIGSSVMMAATPMTIVGVMPRGFNYPFLREMAGWVAMEHREFMGTDPSLAFTERDWNSLVSFARLKNDVSMATAESEVAALAAGLAVEFPRSNANLTVRLTSLLDVEVGRLRQPLYLLLGAVAAILLIAAVNAASLLLARGTSRAGELAVRTALGATRARLVRLFLVESVLYAGLGAVVGLILAHGVLAWVQTLQLQVPRINEVTLDGRVIMVMSAITLVVGIGFGLAPAVQAFRTDLQDQLKDGSRGSSGGLSKSRMQKAFVTTEMALSTMLVIGAGLLVTSFLNTISEDPGFDPDGIMSVRISLPSAYMQDSVDMWSGSNQFFDRLAAETRRIPGVETVALSYTNPLEPTTAFNMRFQIPGFLERPRAEQPAANLRTVTPEFFDAFRIPVLLGRTFTDRDVKESPGVVVINQAFRERFFGDENPIGHFLEGPNFWGPSGYPARWEIVGVVGDVRSGGLAREPAPAYYFPFRQAPMGNMRLIARSGVDPATLVPTIRETVWSMDNTIPMENLYTMKEFIAQSLATPRLAMVAVGSFAFLALLLAAIGVYGVLSHSVGLRRMEFGIRQALGADRNRILHLVLRQGLLVAVLGLALGTALSMPASKLLDASLYHVTITHIPTLAIVLVVLLLVALIACLVPALRATQVDPLRALRAD